MGSKLKSLGVFGMEAFIVEVEADISRGLPSFDVVGLPDASVKESRDRVRAAIKNSGFSFPVGRITVNLAPADMKKQGSIYDLPILISLLKASEQIDVDTSNSVFIGELSLFGEVRPITGVLPMTIKAFEAGYEKIFVPEANANEGSIVEGIDVIAVKDIDTLLLHLSGKKIIAPTKFHEQNDAFASIVPDFSEVKGQLEAKRAMEISAAGGHNIILVGPPGSGRQAPTISCSSARPAPAKACLPKGYRLFYLI